MSLANNPNRTERFIHEIFHNIAEDLKIDVDLVSEIIELWEKYKEENFIKGRKMNDILIGQFDAKVWAKEFIKTVKVKPHIATDEGTMIGWFANAIMAGYDKVKQETLNGTKGGGHSSCRY